MATVNVRYFCEVRRKKEGGRGKKEEGRRKKEERRLIIYIPLFL
ncbi:hypothetical protein [Okeania sp. SIO2C9]|nr:hypothetical protein [Okeania sp. SIO2C9]